MPPAPASRLQLGAEARLQLQQAALAGAGLRAEAEAMDGRQQLRRVQFGRLQRSIHLRAVPHGARRARSAPKAAPQRAPPRPAQAVPGAAREAGRRAPAGLILWLAATRPVVASGAGGNASGLQRGPAPLSSRWSRPARPGCRGRSSTSVLMRDRPIDFCLLHWS